MRGARIALLAALAAALGALARAGEAVPLRLRLEKGRTYAQWIDLRQRIVQTPGGEGKEETVETRLGLGLSLVVTDVTAEGAMRARVTIARLLVEEKSAAEAFSFDSAAKEKKPSRYAPPYAALAGATFAVELSPLGRVPSAEGLDALGRRAADSAPGEGMRSRLAGLAEERLAPEALARSLERLAGFLPEEPVAPGSRWTRREERPDGLPVAVETVYEVESRAEGKITITVSTRTEPLPEAEPLDLAIAGLRSVLRGEGKGRMVVDEATGWVESARVEGVLSGEMRGAISEKERAAWPVRFETTLSIGPMPKEPDE